MKRYRVDEECRSELGAGVVLQHCRVVTALTKCSPLAEDDEVSRGREQPVLQEHDGPAGVGQAVHGEDVAVGGVHSVRLRGVSIRNDQVVLQKDTSTQVATPGSVGLARPGNRRMSRRYS